MNMYAVLGTVCVTMTILQRNESFIWKFGHDNSNIFRDIIIVLQTSSEKIIVTIRKHLRQS